MKFFKLLYVLGISSSIFISKPAASLSKILYLALQGKEKELLVACSRKTFDCATDSHICSKQSNSIDYTISRLSEQEKNLLNKLNQKEIEENKKGRYTFVHGQAWEHEWNATLYKMLYEKTQKTKYPLHEFVRFNKPTQINTKKEQQRHDDVKIHGNPYRFGKCYALFLNAPLFGRYGATIECLTSNSGFSSNYDNNRNEKNFTKFNLRHLYKKYQKELENLKREHEALSSQGRILLYSMTKPYAQKHTYLCGGGGVKKQVTINGKKTDDVCLFIDTLKNNPKALNQDDFDWPEFCLVLSKHETIKPSPDCHVYSFNTVDPQKWAIFCKKRDALFTKIRAEIKP